MDKRNEIDWTIGICTVPYRARKLKRLLKCLMPQVEKFKGRIEVIIFFNNLEHKIGYFRQGILNEARGRYISFVDDDDLVVSDFCETIMPLLDGVDYIGFNVELRNDGSIVRPVYHTLKYTWSEDDRGFYRGVTHLNPILTKLAKLGEFPDDTDSGEDYQWGRQVQKRMNELKRTSEHYIDRDMYLYDHWGHEEIGIVLPHKVKQPKFNSKYIRLHPESTK